MRILLPPSEAKRPGGGGPSLRELGWGPPGLAAPRRAVARAVGAAIRSDPHGAGAALGLPQANREDTLAANRVVDRSPTMRALDRYDGVLYRALDPGSLTARRRWVAEESVVVFSALLGVARGAEAIPWYRVPAAATLAGPGPLERFWRTPLERHLRDELAAEVVVDLRSSDYLAMWPDPPGALHVRVLTSTPAGGARPLSYPGKQGKGWLVRALVERPPRRLDHVIDAGRRLGWQAEVRQLRGGRSGLDLIRPA